MSPVTYLQQTSVTDLLHTWLAKRLTPSSLAWLDEKQQQIAKSGAKRVFFTTFSAVPRYTGKQDLKLTLTELQAATTMVPGWLPTHWSVDQAARTLILLVSSANQDYFQTLEQVFTAADMGELVALYQALPLLPTPEQYRARAAEGLRSNIKAVFNAVALRNPYPAKYFDDLAWNQMVLKALFVGSPLRLIQGLDRRANPELARMLIDYAHERWAAGRSVSPELWRPVGKFADETMLTTLERAIATPPSHQQAAAALACSQCPLPQAQTILTQYPDLQAAIQTGLLTWEALNNYEL